MTAAPNAHSAQLELSDSRRANAMLIGTYRVAAASSTMPMFLLACHTKKKQKMKLDVEQIKGEGKKKEREEALLILSGDNQVQCCSEHIVHPI